MAEMKKSAIKKASWDYWEPTIIEIGRQEGEDALLGAFIARSTDGEIREIIKSMGITLDDEDYVASAKKSKIRKENVTEIEVNGEPYFIWESFNGFKGSKENPNQMITNARAVLDFNRNDGFETMDDVVDYINTYFVKSAKKSVSNATMSFTENVNKMRVNNYARTGNINTVMKKRD